MSALTPALHRPVPMNSRVLVPSNYLGRPEADLASRTGTVVGISSMHVIFTYIVLLDIPYNDPDYGEMKALAAPGSELESATEPGKNWRNNSRQR